MKLGVTSALAIISLSAFATAVQAQQPAAAPPAAAPSGAGKPQAWQKPCEGDIGKLCKDAAAKGGNVPECLASHEKELSEDCTSAFLWRYKVAQDCKEDIEKLCKDKVASGATTMSQCFKDNEKALSEKCRTALVKGSKRQKAEDKAKGTGDTAKPEEKAEAPAKATKASKKNAKKKSGSAAPASQEK
jgi:hypothetical protein